MNEKKYDINYLKSIGVDVSKLTSLGTMNYVLQVFSETDKDGNKTFEFDNYMPRKNLVWHGSSDDMSYNELISNLEETKERMKIAIQMIQDFIDGKRDYVYYWQGDSEPWYEKMMADAKNSNK